MGVRWYWGWEMRWHMGDSSSCLLSTWQELGSEELSRQLCSPTFPVCHPQPSARLWEGAGIYPGQTLSLQETALLPHLQGILLGKWDSRTSLDLLPNRSIPGVSELWRADGAEEKIWIPAPPWHGQ